MLTNDTSCHLITDNVYKFSCYKWEISHFSVKYFQGKKSDDTNSVFVLKCMIKNSQPWAKYIPASKLCRYHAFISFICREKANGSEKRKQTNQPNDEEGAIFFCGKATKIVWRKPLPHVLTESWKHSRHTNTFSTTGDRASGSLATVATVANQQTC